jgi:membrane protein YdbS with pleckstrin-like domain
VAYPTRLLGDGEDLVAEIRPHWSFMLGPMAVVVLAVAAAIAGLVISVVPAVVRYLLLGAILASLLWLGARYARWTTTSLVVTSERVVLRSGVLARRGREILLRRLNDLSYTQSILERILGCGSLVIESGGEHGTETVPRLPRPHEVQRLVNDQVARSYAGAGIRPSELSIPEQIEKLDALHRRGIITTAEMRLKRSQLLDRW